MIHGHKGKNGYRGTIHHVHHTLFALKENDMDRRIPLIISEGTPFERGFHLGHTESGRITQSVVAYMELFKQVAGLSRNDVFAYAENFIPAIAHYAPQLLEEERGIAEGAGRDLREIVAINARTEMMYGGNPLP